MKTLKELRQERAAKIAGMTKINLAAEGEERDLTEDEKKEYDGLNAVPTGHYRQIIARRDEDMLSNQLGVMRIPGKGLTVNVPLDAEADLAFASTSEQADNYANVYERDWPALGTVAMTLVKYTKKIALTEELLEDEDSNLLAFVSNFVGRSMAMTHNSLLLTELRTGGTAGLTLDSASTHRCAAITRTASSARTAS